MALSAHFLKCKLGKVTVPTAYDYYKFESSIYKALIRTIPEHSEHPKNNN